METQNWALILKFNSSGGCKHNFNNLLFQRRKSRWHDTESSPLSLSPLPPVSIFPPSVLMMEVEASPAETTQTTTPLCLTKYSTIDAQTHPELPSSTVLGRPQSPAGLPEGRSEIKRRPQGSSTYIRAKIKVRTERDRAQHNVADFCLTVQFLRLIYYYLWMPLWIISFFPHLR